MSAFFQSRIVQVLLGVFVIWWIVQDPTGAGHFVGGILGWLVKAAHSLTAFLGSI